MEHELFKLQHTAARMAFELKGLRSDIAKLSAQIGVVDNYVAPQTLLTQEDVNLLPFGQVVLSAKLIQASRRWRRLLALPRQEQVDALQCHNITIERVTANNAVKLIRHQF